MVDGWLAGWMEEGCIYGWIDRGIDGWDGWMDGNKMNKKQSI